MNKPQTDIERLARVVFERDYLGQFKSVHTPLRICLETCDDLSGPGDYRDKKGLTHACKMGVTRYYLENAQ